MSVLITTNSSVVVSFVVAVLAFVQITPGQSSRTPADAPRGPAETQGVVLDCSDLVRSPEAWWTFNAARFALPRSDDSARVAWAASRPSVETIRATVEPVLFEILTTTDDEDLAEATLLALAITGRRTGCDHMVPVLSERLGAARCGPWAALALGLSGQPRAVAPLIELVRAGAGGRVLVGQDEVPDRTRAFATHGLGLFAATCTEPDARAALAALRVALRADSPGIQVAAVLAIAAVAVDPAVRLDVLDEVWRDREPSRALARAYVPSAVCRVLTAEVVANNDVLRDRLEEYQHGPWLAAVRARRGVDAGADGFARAALLALGATAVPDDEEIRAAITASALGDSDRCARYHAILALGRIGGAAHRATLLAILREKRVEYSRAWTMLALGVSQHDRPTDPAVTAGLVQAFRAADDPWDPIAPIALGLTGVAETHGLLLARLAEHRRGVRDVDGLATGLGLLRIGSPAAIASLGEVLRSSVRRPGQLHATAVALHRLGDRQIGSMLVTRYVDGSGNLGGTAACAAALAEVGDHRAVPPLVAVLRDGSRSIPHRSIAAATLGVLCDDAPLRWNARLGQDLVVSWEIPFLYGSDGVFWAM